MSPYSKATRDQPQQRHTCTHNGARLGEWLHRAAHPSVDQDEIESRFRTVGIDLTVRACRTALAEPAIAPQGITHTAADTCTTRGCPGLRPSRGRDPGSIFFRGAHVAPRRRLRRRHFDSANSCAGCCWSYGTRQACESSDCCLRAVLMTYRGGARSAAAACLDGFDRAEVWRWRWFC